MTDTPKAETAYRLYIVDKNGRIIIGRDAFASSDEEAIQKAKEILGNDDIEIWHGRRRVGLVAASSPLKEETKRPDQ